MEDIKQIQIPIEKYIKYKDLLAKNHLIEEEMLGSEIPNNIQCELNGFKFTAYEFYFNVLLQIKSDIKELPDHIIPSDKEMIFSFNNKHYKVFFIGYQIPDYCKSYQSQPYSVLDFSIIEEIQ